MATVTGTVSLRMIDGTLMAGMDSRGKIMVIGTKQDENPEWIGIKASDLLLLSAASCATYDIITILNKQRAPIQDIHVTCTGEQMAEPPYSFISIHLHYKIIGPCETDRVWKAIRLSEDKYCSVLNTLRLAVKVTSDFEIVP